ncbi:hypothetical protein F5B19DRAFT_394752 [Rostrohypoxylon terebratum]|nr:hypothetical protein F5B19DRAFT_394752 [Rostrohypoxylon terebratum]
MNGVIRQPVQWHLAFDRYPHEASFGGSTGACLLLFFVSRCPFDQGEGWREHLSIFYFFKLQLLSLFFLLRPSPRIYLM